MEQDKRNDKDRRRTGRPRSWARGLWLNGDPDSEPTSIGEVARSWGATSWPVNK